MEGNGNEGGKEEERWDRQREGKGKGKGRSSKRRGGGRKGGRGHGQGAEVTRMKSLPMRWRKKCWRASLSNESRIRSACRHVDTASGQQREEQQQESQAGQQADGDKGRRQNK